MRVKIDEVPLGLRRRAARHLEAIRGTPLAAGARAARLGDEACPVFRPDVRGVAYWELEVVGVKAAARPVGDGRVGRSDRGFLILSTGPHDVPLPHWSLELEPPSRSLEAQSKGKVVGRVVKLDSLAYVGEDAKGTYLGHVGQFPPMLTSLPPVEGRPLSSLESRPTAASPSDKRVARQRVRRAGVRSPRPKLAPWPSWAQAKKGYASAFKPLLAALRRRADLAWQVEALVEKLGEGIHEGDTLVVPLLKPGKAKLSGDGAAAVTMRVLDRAPPAVELRAGSAEKKAEQSFELRLDYRDGTSETLLFFVVPKGTPSNQRRVLPHPVPVLPPR
ncbi:MAG: hypothetical protein ACM3QU_12295 [Verrucomicrobiota bacterium]